MPYLTLIRWGFALAMVALVCGGLVKCGYDRGSATLANEKAAHQATREANAVVLADLAAKSRAAEQAAITASEQARSDRAANDAKYEEAKADAKQARKDLVDGLRRGDVSLQPWWSCSATGPSEGDAADVAGRQDGYADLRAAGAADLVAAGDAADSWITWLQDELIATRKACGVTQP